MADNVQICLRTTFMPKQEFVNVARQLEDTTSKLKNTSDPRVRLKLLSQMRRLLAEADRLLADEDEASDVA